MTRKEARAARLQQQTAALNHVVGQLLAAMPSPEVRVITKRERRALLVAIEALQKRVERLNVERKAAAT